MNEEIELRAKKLLLHMVSIFIGEARDAEELSNLTGLGVNHAAPCIALCEACTAYKTYVSVENHYIQPENAERAVPRSFVLSFLLLPCSVVRRKRRI